MGQIEEAWNRICSWFSDHDSFAREVFYAGATDREIMQLESSLSVKLPEDFKQSYRIHNGSNLRRGLFLDSEYLLSLDEVLRAWTSWNEACGIEDEEEDAASGQIKDMRWNRKWIPITDSGSGDHYCVDLDPGETGLWGQIIDFSHEEGPLRVVARSLTDWLSDFADLLESGKYEYDDGMRQIVPANPRLGNEEIVGKLH